MRYFVTVIKRLQKYIQNIRLLSLCVVLFSVVSHAQNMQWSNPTKLKGPAIFSKVIGENEKGIFLLRYRNRFYSKSIVLERYNHLLVLEEGKALELRNARLIKLYMSAKGLLIVKSKYSNSERINKLTAQWYDFDFKPLGEATLLATLAPKEFGDRGNFRLRISDNHQYISLLYSEASSDKQVILHHRQFSADLELLKTKNLLLPYKYHNFILGDFDLTNKGTLTMSCKTLKRVRRRIVHTDVRLFEFKDSSVSDFIVLDTLAFKTGELIYDRVNDRSVFVGLYGLPKEYGIAGSFFCRIDSSRKSVSTILGRFSEGFIEDVKTNNRNEGKISEGFEIIKAIPRDDGGVMLVTEQKEIATEDDIIMVNGIPQSTSKNIYNFNEILVINYDNEGFMDWHKLITKNQTTVNDGGYYSSVSVYVGDKFIQLLYNDQIRTSGEVMKYTLYNNGTEESTKLLKSEIDQVAIIPTESKQVSSNKMIIPTTKNRRFALLKLLYN